MRQHCTYRSNHPSRLQPRSRTRWWWCYYLRWGIGRCWYHHLQHQSQRCCPWCRFQSRTGWFQGHSRSCCPGRRPQYRIEWCQQGWCSLHWTMERQTGLDRCFKPSCRGRQLIQPTSNIPRVVGVVHCSLASLSRQRFLAGLGAIAHGIPYGVHFRDGSNVFVRKLWR